MNTEKVRLTIHAIADGVYGPSSYVLLLLDKKDNRYLPIIIGSIEANIIINQMKYEKIFHKNTFYFTSKILEVCGYQLKEVIINDLFDSTFRARVVLFHDENQITKTFEARPSDAIGLANELEVPIFASESIMEIAAITTEEFNKKKDKPSQEEKEENEETTLKVISDKKLQYLLSEAIKNENYERAAEIRDEINKRK